MATSKVSSMADETSIPEDETTSNSKPAPLGGADHDRWSGDTAERTLECLCDVATHVTNSDGGSDIPNSILGECPPMLSSSLSKTFSLLSEPGYHFRIPHSFLHEVPSPRQLRSVLSLAKFVAESHSAVNADDDLLRYLLDFLPSFLFIDDSSSKLSSVLSDYFPTFFDQLLLHLDRLVASHPSTLDEVSDCVSLVAIEAIHRIKLCVVKEKEESETSEQSLSKLFLHSLSDHPLPLLTRHLEPTLSILIQAILEDYENHSGDIPLPETFEKHKVDPVDVRGLLKVSLQGKYSCKIEASSLCFTKSTNHSSHNSNSSFSSIPYSNDLLSNYNTNDKFHGENIYSVKFLDNAEESSSHMANSFPRNANRSWKSTTLRQTLLKFCSRMLSPDISGEWLESHRQRVEKILQISFFQLRSALVLFKFHYKDEFHSLGISKSDLSDVFRIATSACEILSRLCMIKHGDLTFEKCVSFLLDIAEAASLSPWRKTSGCQLLFQAALTAVISTCHFDPQSIARSSLLQFRHLVFTVCSQTEEKKKVDGSKSLSMHEILINACCSLLQITWKIDSASVTSFLLSLAKCVNERVDDDKQHARLLRLRAHIIPMLVKAVFFLKENNVIESIMNLLLECLEGEAKPPSPFRNQVLFALSQLLTIGYEKGYRDALTYLILSYKLPLSSLPAGSPISFSSSLLEEMDRVLPDVFLHIAKNLSSENFRLDFLHRILLLASEIGLVVEARSGSYGGRILGNLLPAIASVCRGRNPLDNVDPSTLKLFKNLWYYIALYGLAPPLPGVNRRKSSQSLPLSSALSEDSSITSWRAVSGPYQWKEEWIPHVLEIASATPPLVLNSVNWLEDEVELNALHNPGSRRGSGNEKAVSLQRRALSLALGTYVDADALSSISGVKATYLLAVVFLEVSRLSQNGGILKTVLDTQESSLPISAMQCTVKYLNGSNLLPAVTSCLSSVALLAFDSALSSLKFIINTTLSSGDFIGNAIASHARFLIELLKQNNEHVRDLSATMLSRLRSSHSQVLWNSSCIDALFALGTEKGYASSGNESLVIEWITCAMLLAPLTTQGLMQEKLQHSDFHSTTTLLSLLEKMNLEVPAVYLTVPVDSLKRSEILTAGKSNLNFLSACIHSSNIKSQYLGEICGMKNVFTNLNSSKLSITSDSSSPSPLGVQQNLVHHFIQLLQQFVSSAQRKHKVNIYDFQESCLRATSLIISETDVMDDSSLNYSSNDISKLLRLLCWSPVRVFTPESLAIGVFVWSWLISAKPNLEIQLLSELVDAWIWTIHERRGIFANQTASQGPFSLLRPLLIARDKEDPPEFDPVAGIASHRIWLSFFNDRLEVCSHGYHEQLSLFLLLLNNTFHNHQHFSSHPSALGTFFFLLNFGVKFVDCHNLRSLNSNPTLSLLSHRIYRAAFHWFSFKPGYFEIKSNSYLSTEFELSTISSFITILLNRPHSNYFHSSISTHPLGSHSNSDSVKTKNFQHPVWSTLNLTDHDLYKQIIDLLYLLCSNEADRLETWAYPLRENTVQRIKSSLISAERWKEHVFAAWIVDPQISIFLVDRFPYINIIKQELTSLIQNNVTKVRDIPEAIPYFLTPEAVESESPNLLQLPYCAPCSITAALRFLTPAYKGHTRVMAYVLRVLENYPPRFVTFFMPQLIQALRYDHQGLVEKYLLNAANKSILFSHILIWQLQGEEAPTEEDLKYHKDPSLKQTHNLLWDIVPRVRQKIIDGFSFENKIAFDHEFDFFGSVTSISGVLKPVPKEKRKAAIRPELEKIVLKGDDVYLPTHPSLIVKGIVLDSGIPLQSAEKVPIMVSFSCVDRHDYSKTSTQACIFKVGDDCRQDVLALQVISLLRDVFKAIGLDLYLFPYGVLPTGFERGIIEVVPNTKSRNQMGEVTDGGLFEIFQQNYGPVGSLHFETARKNFILSSAGYAVASLLLQPKDRHNGNLLFDKDGHLVHIDFGFILETSPGGNMRFESANFKLSHEMTQLLDPSGTMKSETWDYFVSLCVKGYLAARLHMEGILNTVLLMIDSGLPCFSRGDPIGNLRRRFHLEMGEREAANFMIATCADAYNKWSTAGYDLIQYLQQGIEK